MVYDKSEELKIKRELDVRNRVNLLNQTALRAALLSIQDVDELEKAVKIGEDYMREIFRKRIEWMNIGMKIALRKDLENENSPVLK